MTWVLRLWKKRFAPLVESGCVITDEIAGQNACYLETIYEAELYTSERVKAMTGVRPDRNVNVKKVVADIEKKSGITYAGLQRMAVELAASSGVLVLTGGPGTGKTTAVRGILALFDKMGLKPALAAPDGKGRKTDERADRPGGRYHT